MSYDIVTIKNKQWKVGFGSFVYEGTTDDIEKYNPIPFKPPEDITVTFTDGSKAEYRIVDDGTGL